VRAIALTGGPGAGKTTVLDALRACGYECVPDTARAIIQERLRLSLSPRPSPREFADEILKRDREQYQRVTSYSGLVFFDRCVVDALGMVDQLGGLAAPLELEKLLEEYEYFHTTFIFPPWEEIYTTDAERDHTFAHAVAVHREVSAWYSRCGYDLVEVSRGPIQQRCDFILTRVT
jgi:predicted ATPase